MGDSLEALQAKIAGLVSRIDTRGAAAPDAHGGASAESKRPAESRHKERSRERRRTASGGESHSRRERRGDHHRSVDRSRRGDEHRHSSKTASTSTGGVALVDRERRGEVRKDDRRDDREDARRESRRERREHRSEPEGGRRAERRGSERDRDRERRDGGGRSERGGEPPRRSRSPRGRQGGVKLPSGLASSRLSIKYASRDLTPTNELYIAGWPVVLGTEELKQTFKSFGFRVLQTSLLPDKKGQGLCAGFVHVSSEAEAASAIRDFNNREIQQLLGGHRAAERAPLPTGGGRPAEAGVDDRSDHRHAEPRLEEVVPPSGRPTSKSAPAQPPRAEPEREPLPQPAQGSTGIAGVWARKPQGGPRADAPLLPPGGVLSMGVGGVGFRDEGAAPTDGDQPYDPWAEAEAAATEETGDRPQFPPPPPQFPPAPPGPAMPPPPREPLPPRSPAYPSRPSSAAAPSAGPPAEEDEADAAYGGAAYGSGEDWGGASGSHGGPEEAADGGARGSPSQRTPRPGPPAKRPGPPPPRPSGSKVMSLRPTGKGKAKPAARPTVPKPGVAKPGAARPGAARPSADGAAAPAPSGAAPSGAAPSGAATSGAAPTGAAPSGAAPSGATPSGAAGVRASPAVRAQSLGVTAKAGKPAPGATPGAGAQSPRPPAPGSATSPWGRPSGLAARAAKAAPAARPTTPQAAKAGQAAPKAPVPKAKLGQTAYRPAAKAAAGAGARPQPAAAPKPGAAAAEAKAKAKAQDEAARKTFEGTPAEPKGEGASGAAGSSGATAPGSFDGIGDVWKLL